MKLFIGALFAVLSIACSQTPCPITGIYFQPIENSCDRFTRCIFGMRTEQTCAEGLQFDPISSQCDLPSAVGCKKCPLYIQPGQFKAYHDSANCSIGFVCFGERDPFAMNCNEAYHFDPDTLMCIRPEKSECVPPPSATTTQTLSTTTTTPKSSTITTTNPTLISNTTQDVSNDLNAIRVKYNLPGLSALAFKNEQIVAQGASGYRRQGDPTPLLVTDPINLGSCSKWMTATVAGRLVDTKIISWTTQVHECFANYKSFNTAFQNATLEQFLAHRSGVQQQTTFYNRYLPVLFAQKGTIRQIRFWVAETILKDAPEVEPGEYLYANHGYTVAAAMMEQLTGLDWESLMQEHAFTVLKMSSAAIGPVYDNTVPPKTPVGHELHINSTVPVPGPFFNATLLHSYQAASGPAGYIACTLQDWVKFLHAHVTGVSTGYLSSETAAKLKRSFIGEEGYGLGVIASNRNWATPGQAFHHGGDVFGQDTVFWMTPGRDLIVVAYTNCRSVGDQSPYLALDDAAGMLIGRFQ